MAKLVVRERGTDVRREDAGEGRPVRRETAWPDRGSRVSPACKWWEMPLCMCPARCGSRAQYRLLFGQKEQSRASTSVYNILCFLH